ncbi:MAG: hypothetical protein ACXVI9_08965 [Mucilaginibacter sp.]
MIDSKTSTNQPFALHDISTNGHVFSGINPGPVWILKKDPNIDPGACPWQGKNVNN